MVSFPKTNSSPFALGTQVMVMMVMMVMMIIVMMVVMVMVMMVTVVLMVMNKLFPICQLHIGGQ